MVDRVGADQLMWGTDMPFQGRFWHVCQSRDLIVRHAPLTDAERAANRWWLRRPIVGVVSVVDGPAASR